MKYGLATLWLVVVIGSPQAGAQSPAATPPTSPEGSNRTDPRATERRSSEAPPAESSDREFSDRGGRGFGGPGGGGPPGPLREDRRLVKDHDTNDDGWLNQAERRVAREALKKERTEGGTRDGRRGERGPGPNGFGPPGNFGPPGFGPPNFGPPGFGPPEFGPPGFGPPGFGPPGIGRPGFGPPGMGGPGGRVPRAPAKPGEQIRREDVESFPNASLYEPTVLRTFFFEFENADWEAELADFHGTDVEVPATLTVDGQKYPLVGVSFRGMSSYMAVPAGYKRSLNVSLDLANAKQRLYGYKTLNLLNNHEDPSQLSTVLYSHIARQYLPAPQANVVRVVIQGENWGLYTNVQQFNKEFLAEHFGTTEGNRWKVSGSPGGGGGLDYAGDEVENYRRRYEIKSKDTAAAWNDLISLCRTIQETPTAEFRERLASRLDLDQLLWFLALDVALVNNDGYWIRASDYSIYEDPKGKFHVLPHDMNEAFKAGMGPPGGPRGGGPGFGPRPDEGNTPKGRTGPNERSESQAGKNPSGLEDRPGQADRRSPGPGGFGPGGFGPGGFGPGGFGPGGFGPGGFGPGGMGPGGFGRGPGGPRGGGIELDPLVGLDDARKPLRSKVLAVPELREQYLRNVRAIAQNSLDWNNLGPLVAQYRRLLEREITRETRQLESAEAFLRVTADGAADAAPGGREVPLRTFADRRRAYLLAHPEIAKLKP